MTIQRTGGRPAFRRPHDDSLGCFHQPGDEGWCSEIADISATGVGSRRPLDGVIGDVFAPDMLIGEEPNIHVEARLARMTDASD